jgi:hypothetical protein
MIETENTETNPNILGDRQQLLFKGAVLLVCAGILALVLWSGTHETRTADYCGRVDTRAACAAPSTPMPSQPAKGALAPFGAGSVDRRAGN